jgi:enamine deaminase RidA (YjgF/YER057c/UK114 family)
MSIERIEPGPRMSRAVVHGDTVYVSGVVAANADAGIADQTRNILERIEKLLAAAGSSKSQILSANVWLADISTFDDMNAVWDAWVEPGSPPARATVEARLASPNYKVEIAVIAAR